VIIKLLAHDWLSRLKKPCISKEAVEKRLHCHWQISRISWLGPWWRGFEVYIFRNKNASGPFFFKLGKAILERLHKVALILRQTGWRGKPSQLRLVIRPKSSYDFQHRHDQFDKGFRKYTIMGCLQPNRNTTEWMWIGKNKIRFFKKKHSDFF
jgi:hypothetical protein